MINLLTPKQLIFKIALCFALLVIVMFACSLIGTQKISLPKVLHGPGENIDYDLYIGVRIPRIILAALIGAALAASGVALQAILKNPLAEPYILGISSGAAMGIIIAELAGMSGSFWLAGSPRIAMAFLCAIATVWLVWLIGHFAGGSTVTSLLLAGVVVNSFFTAVITLMTSLLKNEQLRSTIWWLMGTIGEKDFPTLLISAILIITGIILLFFFSHKLNILAFGSSEAHALGVNPKTITLIAFALTSFITAVNCICC